MNTPKSKRLKMAKISAFVAILALIFGAFAVTASADSTNPNVTTTDPALTYQAHPSTPDTLELMVYKVGVYDEAILTESLETSYKLASDNAGDQQWQVEHAMYVLGQYTYTINRTYYYAPTDDRVYNSRCSVAPAPSLSSGDSNFQRLSWSPFFVYPEEWDKLPYIQFVYSQTSYHTMRVSYSYYDVDEQHEYTGVMSIPKNTASSAYGIGLGSIFDLIGVDETHYTYVNTLQITLNHYEDSEHTLIDYYCPFTSLNVDYHADNINTNTYADYMSRTHTIYKQVINSGDASDFLGAMSNWVSNFFSTVLFEFGSVPITPGAILSVGAGLALTIWILKLFMGG